MFLVIISEEPTCLPTAPSCAQTRLRKPRFSPETDHRQSSSPQDAGVPRTIHGFPDVYVRFPEHPIPEASIAARAWFGVGACGPIQAARRRAACLRQRSATLKASTRAEGVTGEHCHKTRLRTLDFADKRSTSETSQELRTCCGLMQERKLNSIRPCGRRVLWPSSYIQPAPQAHSSQKFKKSRNGAPRQPPSRALQGWNCKLQHGTGSSVDQDDLKVTKSGSYMRESKGGILA